MWIQFSLPVGLQLEVDLLSYVATLSLSFGATYTISFAISFYSLC